jgi:hypothetical protein
MFRQGSIDQQQVLQDVAKVCDQENAPARRPGIYREKQACRIAVDPAKRHAGDCSPF